MHPQVVQHQEHLAAGLADQPLEELDQHISGERVAVHHEAQLELVERVVHDVLADTVFLGLRQLAAVAQRATTLAFLRTLTRPLLGSQPDTVGRRTPSSCAMASWVRPRLCMRIAVRRNCSRAAGSSFRTSMRSVSMPEL